WVNGPLSNGSPVQILNGWASVTGNENLNVPGIGTRQAWIVTSQLNQSLDLMTPSATVSTPGTRTNVVASLDLDWSFDKSSDLLLRTSKIISFSVHSVAMENLPNNCYPACGGNPYTTVMVTHDMNANLNLTLLLSTTNLTQGKPHASGPTLSLMDMLAGLPWMPFGLVGLAAAAIIGVTVWLTRKYRRTPLPEPNSTSVPAPNV
ncbi:hypothetical protein J2P12_04180, partial [Candidatus Bathyarchaeota archaeon]|nr:hypothetical protein [Candidatus Bathyarchaeota archaeon]